MKRIGLRGPCILFSMLTLILFMFPQQASAYTFWKGYKVAEGEEVTFIPNAYFSATSKTHMKEAMKKWEADDAAGRELMSLSSSTHTDARACSHKRSHMSFGQIFAIFCVKKS